MTSQSTLMVTAPLARNSIAGLRELLSTMNRAPGQADPNNSLVPFARLENLHFARFVILDDPSVDDIQNLYGVPGESTVYLALACDFDGPPAQFLTDLINCAGPGLRQIFSFCSDFSGAGDLLQWMRDHDLPVVTQLRKLAGADYETDPRREPACGTPSTLISTPTPARSTASPLSRSTCTFADLSMPRPPPGVSS